MAARAIGVFDTRAAALVAGGHGIAAVLMHMRVVPGVLAGGRCGLVRAVRRSRRPGELQGQHQQQEDDEPATHGCGF